MNGSSTMASKLAAAQTNLCVCACTRACGVHAFVRRKDCATSSLQPHACLCASLFIFLPCANECMRSWDAFLVLTP